MGVSIQSSSSSGWKKRVEKEVSKANYGVTLKKQSSECKLVNSKCGRKPLKYIFWMKSNQNLFSVLSEAMRCWVIIRLPSSEWEIFKFLWSFPSPCTSKLQAFEQNHNKLVLFVSLWRTRPIDKHTQLSLTNFGMICCCTKDTFDFSCDGDGDTWLNEFVVGIVSLYALNDCDFGSCVCVNRSMCAYSQHRPVASQQM